MHPLWLAFALSACVLWDDSPYAENLRRLSDVDGDGFTLADNDCNDADPQTHPGATDKCDAVDNDCDGSVDEDLPDTLWCRDMDVDGFGDPATGTRTCFPQEGWVLECSDCDDSAGAINPGAQESCNGQDDNCDGLTDPSDAQGSTEWHADEDGDGFGAVATYEVACDQPAGAVTDSSDCDDDASDTYPGAAEVCNDGKDNNCDGETNGCTWAGENGLTEETAAFIGGAAFDDEIAGYSLGAADANADGVSDLIVFSSGAMYGDDSLGTVHLWYGAPTGVQTIENAPAHIVGASDLYLGAATFGSPLLATTDPSDGGHLLIVTSQGFSDEYDPAGVLLRVPAGLYGRHDADPGEVFARGRSSMEGFGSTLTESENAADAGPALVIGAPFNGEAGDLAGTVYLCGPERPDAVDAFAAIRGEPADMLGYNASGDRDLDGDGLDDLAMGAIATSAPAALVFRGPLSGGYAREDADIIVASAGVAPAGMMTVPDTDGDGLSDLAVPAVNELAFVPGTVTGAVTLEEAARATLVLEQEDRVVVGYGLSTGDPQGDGGPDLAIGVPLADGPPQSGGSFEGGAVYVVPLGQGFEGGSLLTDVAEAIFYGPDARGTLGFTLAFGDVNSDGFDDLAMSAVGWSTGTAVDAGGVWFILGGGI